MQNSTRRLSYLLVASLMAHQSVQSGCSMHDTFLAGGAIAGYLAGAKVIYDLVTYDDENVTAGSVAFSSQQSLSHERIGGKRSRIREHQQRLEGLEKLAVTFETKLDGLDKRLAENMMTRMTDVNNSVQQLRVHVDQLAQAQDQYQTLNKTKSATVEPEVERILVEKTTTTVRESLKGQLQEYDSRLTNFGKSIDDVRSMLTKQEQVQSQVADKVDQQAGSVEQQYGQLHDIVAQLKSEIQSMQKDLYELDEEVFVYDQAEEPADEVEAADAQTKGVSVDIQEQDNVAVDA